MTHLLPLFQVAKILDYGVPSSQNICLIFIFLVISFFIKSLLKWYLLWENIANYTHNTHTQTHARNHMHHSVYSYLNLTTFEGNHSKMHDLTRKFQASLMSFSPSLLIQDDCYDPVWTVW